jgi:hypothetical protein
VPRCALHARFAGADSVHGRGQRTSRGVSGAWYAAQEVESSFSCCPCKTPAPTSDSTRWWEPRLSLQGVIGTHCSEFGTVVVVPSGQLAQVGAFVAVPGTLMKNLTGHSG